MTAVKDAWVLLDAAKEWRGRAAKFTSMDWTENAKMATEFAEAFERAAAPVGDAVVVRDAALEEALAEAKAHRQALRECGIESPAAYGAIDGVCDRIRALKEKK